MGLNGILDHSKMVVETKQELFLRLCYRICAMWKWRKDKVYYKPIKLTSLWITNGMISKRK